MKVLKFIVFISILTCISSCEKIFIEKNTASSPQLCFETMWKTLDEKYSFFTYKNIDWQQKHKEYNQRIHDNMTSKELFTVLSELLYELRDGHVNLSSSFDVSRNWDWFLDYPPNFNYNIMFRNYLGKNHRMTGPLLNTVIDSIGYIWYSSFSKTISESNIDFLVKDFADTKGIIIDIRDNGGGSVSNISVLASRFFDMKRTVSQTLYKKGPGHDDFFAPVSETMSPAGERQYLKPVVILMNRKCFSAANDFILTMKCLPHVTLIGDQSGGGGGIPVDYELPNGWTFRFSTTMTLSPDGFNVENGIPPDIHVNLLPEDEAQGIDTMIEYALEYLKNK